MKARLELTFLMYKASCFTYANKRIESHLFSAKFALVLTTLCMLGLKFLELSCAFLRASLFKGFRFLRIMGRCTSRYLFLVRWITQFTRRGIRIVSIFTVGNTEVFLHSL